MMASSSVYEGTIANQNLVSSPDLSAWVAANAGAGKTKVLTDRVMRLLLTGTDPSRILCITFTKAAAAEMAERLFHRLGCWALMEDDALACELLELDSQLTCSTEELSNARRLFARALETPGGLKIQTIHSFCESLLKRFPVEAKVLPGFSVVEEVESNSVLRGIIDTLIAKVQLKGGEIFDAFVKLSKKVNADSMRREICDLVRQDLSITQAIHRAGSEETYWEEMANYLGIQQTDSNEQLMSAYWKTLDLVWLEAAYSALLAGSKSDVEAANRLRTFLDASVAARNAAAEVFFLTSTGSPRKKLAHKDAISVLPDIQERLSVYQALFLEVRDKVKGLEIFGQTKVLHYLARRTAEEYDRFKLERGWLDFDDLIYKTARLFRETSQSWVMYKLDQGIDHLLLDEAQDTSDGQWQVVMGPLQEFFSGHSARDVQRTVFVVGDEKQSIYSFQGADVGLFRAQQGYLDQMIVAAGKRFEVKDLTLSFRSTPPVLQFVDTVFGEAAAARGVTEHTELRHHAYRASAAGLVELWPLVERPEYQKGNPWDAPVDMPTADNPARLLAKHITDVISAWLENREQLKSRGRPIKPGDIMILCQRRGPVFLELVDALTTRGIPTTGADRLRLKEHVAVRDMMAAMRFILQTRDDLSLAELLKSPLYEFDDDDLFELGHGRRKEESLWLKLTQYAAINGKGSVFDKCEAVVESLVRAKAIALNHGAVAFFTHLLESGNPSGWRRYHKRLGSEVFEVLQEFLEEAHAYERNHPRTLQGFLAYLENLESDLKKEIDGTEDLVRVMTVHGSKGLEADIVFLADAAYENFRKTGSLLTLGSYSHVAGAFFKEAKGYIVHSGRSAEDNSATSLSRSDVVRGRAEEYRRLFYVAMTRARDRLYICGQVSGNTGKEKLLEKLPEEATWYALASRAFCQLELEGKNITTFEAPWGGEIKRLESEQVEEVQPEVEAGHTVCKPVPDWLGKKVPPEKAPVRLQPSCLTLEMDVDAGITTSIHEVPYAPAAFAKNRESAYTRGNALHLLLEKVPDYQDEHRYQAAADLLQRHFGNVPESAREAWVIEVLRVLREPKFDSVFGPNSRAEVPIIGKLETSQGLSTVSGQIDRLVISESEIVIVDYKTNRPPPLSIEEVPGAYILQLAAYRQLLQKIYPKHKMRCALLWTWEARLMEIPAASLDHAFVQKP